MPRQLLSGTVLLGAALLLAGKGPPGPAGPSTPALLRGLRDVPPAMCLLGGASCAPDWPCCIRLAGWSCRGAAGHLPPLRPSPMGRTGRSDPAFQSRETPRPERSVVCGSPAVCPGSAREQSPGSWRECGAAVPPLLWARRRCRRGADPLLGTGDSCSGRGPNGCITERRHVLAPGQAFLLSALFPCGFSLTQFCL